MIPAKVVRDYAASGDNQLLDILTLILHLAKQGRPNLFIPLDKPCNDVQKTLIDYGFRTELQKEKYLPGYVLRIDW